MWIKLPSIKDESLEISIHLAEDRQSLCLIVFFHLETEWDGIERLILKATPQTFC